MFIRIIRRSKDHRRHKHKKTEKKTRLTIILLETQRPFQETLLRRQLRIIRRSKDHRRSKDQRRHNAGQKTSGGINTKKPRKNPGFELFF